ncbi:cytochrome c biogenesis CcdA family protein [Citricoccus sp. NR2]|uniref:cytochrome c biogenesis CcdA family protein n=1 Tax=Citricoccus sp. NR2 TaxID=3004095 RepID=UPI0022DD1393|nr:cytochrome c biogenesis protein CcdA [Citricoccus sp. NR2]WBL20478.1 sulfite exporter TauE/SafE family protein [Citricoccus sp. NR2]
MTDNVFAEIALDGSLLLAIPVAVLAGLVSFLSPCVLPLVPGYLGYVTGLSGANIAEQKRGRMVAGMSLFVLGFTVVFVLIGLVFSRVVVWLQFEGAWVYQVLGLVVILLGVVFMGGFSWFQRDSRLHVQPRAGLWGAPVLGMIFGLGWAPCIGPTMSAVLLLSTAGSPSPWRGAVLAFVYCLGLGLPFILIAMGFNKSMAALGFFRRHRVAVMRFGGGLLILLGLLMVSGLWNTWVLQLQTWFANEVRLPI